MDLTIREIEKACGGALVIQGAAPEEKVTSVVQDSRLVTEGGVFVAAVGERVDGHRYIGQVYEKGAKLVLTQKTPGQVEKEHGVQADRWGSYLVVEEPFQALRALAEYYRSKLRIPIVGITGSVGKTSTKELIAGALSERYCVLKTEGNYNNEIGVPLTLLRIREEHTAAVIEMGISDFGEMHRLSRMVRPNLCVITNIGQCHMETLGSRDGILRAKSEMFDYMAEDGIVCLNGEDDKLSEMTNVRGKRPCFFGLGGNPAEEVYASDIVERGLRGCDARLHIRAGETERCLPLHVPLPGSHMVINAAAAACVALHLGVEPERICEGIRRVSSLPGRANLIWLSHYTLIDDCYNASPAPMRAALDLLSMADAGKVAVLGDMFDLGAESDALHEGIGAYAARKGTDRIFCVGENARHMFEAARRESSPGQQVRYFADRQAFLEALRADREGLIPDGSCVLIKASHGMQFPEIVALLRELDLSGVSGSAE